MAVVEVSAERLLGVPVYDWPIKPRERFGRVVVEARCFWIPSDPARRIGWKRLGSRFVWAA